MSDEWSGREYELRDGETLIDTMAGELRASLGIDSRGDGGERALYRSPVCVNFLAGAMDQVYSARREFGQTASQSVRLALFAFSAGSTLVVAGELTAGLESPARYLGSSLAFLVYALGAGSTWVLYQKLRAGYEIYASSVLHAAVIYRALGLPFSHLWLRLAEDAAVNDHYVTGRFDRASENNFIAIFVGESLPERGWLWRRRLDDVRRGRATSPGRFVAIWKRQGWNLLRSYLWTLLLMCVLLSVSAVFTALWMMLV